MPTTTWPVGQLADYVLEFGAGIAPLIVREFLDRYEAFVAGVNLAARFLKLMEENPDSASYVSGALVGATIGAALGKSRNGALLGAGVGLLVAALVRHAARERQHRSSQV